MNKTWSLAIGGVCALVAGCGGIFQTAGPATLTADPAWMVTPEVQLTRQQANWDCGPAALSTLLSRWQERGAPTVDVRKVFERGHGAGVKAGELRTVARTLGLHAFLVKGTVDDLGYELARGRPVLVGLVNYRGKRPVGHYAVVVGLRRDRSRVLLADPGRGWRDITLPAFELEWGPTRHVAMMVFPPTAEPDLALGALPAAR
jgi:ABC-type bacteriocin/lantibiotic exporter with double-glycine peptidase domain